MIIFPSPSEAHYGYPLIRKPTFSTILQTGSMGREVGAMQEPVSLWEYGLRYEVLRDETQNITKDSQMLGFVEQQTILQFFLACNGQYGEFLFDDPSDNSRTKQKIATADGVNTDFFFVRTITGAGARTFTEQVTANILQPIVVYVNNSPVVSAGNWSISTDQRKLIFVSPPAANALITATFYYYYRCRFITDELELEEFLYNRWSVSALRFRVVNLSGTNVVATNDTFPPPPVT